MNFPRIEWGKGKRFDFSKYLNQPLLSSSKNVTFESLKTDKIIGVDRVTSRNFSDSLASGSGWGIYKDVNNLHTLAIPKIIIRHTLDFWDTNSPSINVLSFGSNLFGDGGGIILGEKGFIYKHSESGNAVSSLHSELYNQSISYIGGISTLVSTTTDALTPALTTIDIMSGIKTMSYITGTHNGAGIIANSVGITTGNLYGVYSKVNNGNYNGSAFGAKLMAFVTGTIGVTRGVHGVATLGSSAYGVYGEADGAATANYGIYGTAYNGVVNWAGFFALGNVYIRNYLRVGGGADNTTNAFGLKFGISEDTNLYRSAVSTLKTDDDFISALTIDAIGGFKDNGVAGIDSTGFVIAVGDTITVSGGIITALSH